MSSQISRVNMYRVVNVNALPNYGVGDLQPASISSDGLLLTALTGGGTEANVEAVDVDGYSALVGLATLGFNFVWNGSAWQRARSASAVNQSIANPLGIPAVAMVGNWAIEQQPAAATQATISRAAGGIGVRHICTSITVTIAAVAAQSNLIFNLRDGATGAGAILWSTRLIAVIGTGQVVTLGGLSIFGSANTALTLESAAAPAATNFAHVALTGYSAA